jgi:hypothetical protein
VSFSDCGSKPTVWSNNRSAKISSFSLFNTVLLGNSGSTNVIDLDFQYCVEQWKKSAVRTNSRPSWTSKLFHLQPSKSPSTEKPLKRKRVSQFRPISTANLRNFPLIFSPPPPIAQSHQLPLQCQAEAQKIQLLAQWTPQPFTPQQFPSAQHSSQTGQEESNQTISSEMFFIRLRQGHA